MDVTDNPPSSISAESTDEQTYTFGSTQIGRMIEVLNTAIPISGINRDALVIVFITSIIETHFRNLSNVNQYPESGSFPEIDGDGSDGTSLGLFQQTPPNGWGTPEQLCTPSYATRAFIGGSTGPNNGNPPGLLDTNWTDGRTPGEAAQAVQGSAFPDRYDTVVPVANECLDQLLTDGDDNGDDDDNGDGDEELPVKIVEFGNSLRVITSSGKSVICVPSPGGLWYCGGESDTGTGPGPDPDGEFSWPFSTSVITSGFGPRTGGTGTFHEGIDFSGGAAVYGADVKVSNDGTVMNTYHNEGFGEYVLVFHGTIDGHDIYTNYGHLINGSSVVTAGQKVTKGDKLARLGDTGIITGPCLHWETHVCAVGAGVVWNTNDDSNPRTAIDPMDFMETYGDGEVV